MADPATLEFYEKQAPFYTASTAESFHRHLEPFLDRLSPAARILELGCGAGRDAARMIERGFHVDPTDGTRAMVRKARERFDIPARLMRFDELSADAEYDAVWAHACLLHSARTDLPDILTSVRRALVPHGLHFANYKLGTAEGRDRLGRLTNLPTQSWLEDAYRMVGFEILETDRYAGKGCDGTQRDWLALTVKRSD